jgi:hypothetical protein
MSPPPPYTAPPRTPGTPHRGGGQASWSGRASGGKQAHSLTNGAGMSSVNPVAAGMGHGAPMRTFQSEAQRLLRECGMEEPAVDRLSHALYWLLFTRPRHRNRGHHSRRRQRAFYGGTYAPRTDARREAG